MFDYNYQDKPLKSLLYSGFLHLIVLLLFWQLKSFLHFGEGHNQLKDKIEIETITPEQLQKWKTVGVENGKKDLFSVPLEQGMGFNQPKEKTQEKVKKAPKQVQRYQKKLEKVQKMVPQKDDRLKLKSLGTQELLTNKMTKQEVTRPSRSIKQNTIDEVPLVPLSKVGKAQNAQEQRQEKSRIISEALNTMGTTAEDRQLLAATGLNVEFNAPEGVDEDKLNSDEKVFYAFQKRTYMNYIGSVVSTYRSLSRSRPNLKSLLSNEPHRLSGRVVFDEKGNILTISILNGSTYDEVQTLFEKILENIRSLPNPPKALVKNHKFTIYYRLNIN